MKHHKSVKFRQILECQAPLHKRKASYWRFSGDASDQTVSFIGLLQKISRLKTWNPPRQKRFKAHDVKSNERDKRTTKANADTRLDLEQGSATFCSLCAD